MRSKYYYIRNLCMTEWMNMAIACSPPSSSAQSTWIAFLSPSLSPDMRSDLINAFDYCLCVWLRFSSLTICSSNSGIFLEALGESLIYYFTIPFIIFCGPPFKKFQKEKFNPRYLVACNECHCYPIPVDISQSFVCRAIDLRWVPLHCFQRQHNSQ